MTMRRAILILAAAAMPFASPARAQEPVRLPEDIQLPDTEPILESRASPPIAPGPGSEFLFLRLPGVGSILDGALRFVSDTNNPIRRETLKYKGLTVTGAEGFAFVRADLINFDPDGLQSALANRNYGPRTSGQKMQALRGANYAVVYICRNLPAFIQVPITSDLADQKVTVPCN